MTAATEIRPLQSLDPSRFDTVPILRRLNSASRRLAELKGAVASIPHQAILINTLGIQEAKDSSEIENIVTTNDELYRADAEPERFSSAAGKEVHRYRQALGVGFDLVQRTGLITESHVCQIQAELLGNDAGIRTTAGTRLVNAQGDVVYTPPQSHDEGVGLLGELTHFINDSPEFDVDPLIKMALIHQEFESIHPFYDGNGRTGRILNVLYLVKESLLNIPMLYLSRPLLHSRGEYYRRLQAVRDKDAWEGWVEYMLAAVQMSALEGISIVNQVGAALLSAKHRIRSQHRFYSQDLINHLFSHPYTKIQFLAESLDVSRLTATKYLDALADDGILDKLRVGRSNYFVNRDLWAILTETPPPLRPCEPITSAVRHRIRRRSLKRSGGRSPTGI